MIKVIRFIGKGALVALGCFFIFTYVNNIRKVHDLKYKVQTLEYEVKDLQGQLERKELLEKLAAGETTNAEEPVYIQEEAQEEAQAKPVESDEVFDEWEDDGDTENGGEHVKQVQVRMVNHEASTPQTAESWQTLSKDNQDIYFVTNASANPFYVEFKTNETISLSDLVISGDENWSYDTDLHQMELHRKKAGEPITIKFPGFGFVHVNVIE